MTNLSTETMLFLMTKQAAFSDQFYSDNDSEWSVPSVYEYAKKNLKVQNIPLTELENNLVANEV